MVVADDGAYFGFQCCSSTLLKRYGDIKSFQSIIGCIQYSTSKAAGGSVGLFPLRQFPLCQFPLCQFPFGQFPTSSIPTLSIPIWSMLTKWELTKWEIDEVGRFTIVYTSNF